MNKLYAALILALTTNYSLAAAEKKINEPKPFDGKPAIVLQVYDVSGKVEKQIKGTTLSIEKNKTNFVG